MDMILVHADEDRAELRAITSVLSLDMELRTDPDAELVDNSFQIVLPEAEFRKYPVLPGHYLYIPGTEWGGPVTELTHSTADRTVTLAGPTWRGLLFQRVIEPPQNEAYLVITNQDAAELVRQAVGTLYGSLYRLPENSGILASAAWRYNVVGKALHKSLHQAGAALRIAYDPAQLQAVLSVTAERDLSDTIELSQDYNVPFTSRFGRVETCNHCLALGSGELLDRMIRNYWLQDDGTVVGTKPQTWDDAQTRTVLLDYSNAESEADLYKSAVDRLTETGPRSEIVLDELSIADQVDLGDTVAVRDRLTGITAKAYIARKILTLKNGRPAITLGI